MVDLREAIAQALHDSDPAYSPPYWEDCTDDMKFWYRKSADVVLGVVHEHADIGAAAEGLLGYEIRAVLYHNWTKEGIDHIERAIAQRAVDAALDPAVDTEETG